MLSKISTCFLFFLIMLFINPINGQNKKSEWTIGLSLASAKYTDNQGKVLGGSFINQSPRINISK